MSTSVLDNAIILVKPSQPLWDYINNLSSPQNMPQGIIDVRSKSKPNSAKRIPVEHKLLTNQTDLRLIKSLELEDPQYQHKEALEISPKDRLLNLEDLHWLHQHINTQNSGSKKKVYLHELFEGSEIVLPKNKEVARDPVLEKRCQKLKNQQDNDRYRQMTKNVDSVRKRLPEDTIAYQMKQINSQLIAIAQFIITVLAGFAFGFIGVELMIGKLDFGFRLLLGIICALVIALAELYFLAKKLNEDLEYVYNANNETTGKKKAKEE